MSEHDDHSNDDHGNGTTTVATVPAAVNHGPVDARITDISEGAADALRRHVEDASGGGNRFIWFLTGFVAALVAGAIAAVIFLAVSDRDDDGNLEIDVPAVEVDIDS